MAVTVFQSLSQSPAAASTTTGNLESDVGQEERRSWFLENSDSLEHSQQAAAMLGLGPDYTNDDGEHAGYYEYDGDYYEYDGDYYEYDGGDAYAGEYDVGTALEVLPRPVDVDGTAQAFEGLADSAHAFEDFAEARFEKYAEPQGPSPTAMAAVVLGAVSAAGLLAHGVRWGLKKARETKK